MEKRKNITDEKDNVDLYEPGHALHLEHEDPTIRLLHRIIRVAVKILAILMVLVIVWGIVDVIYILYQRATEPLFLLLKISDILATFGAFLAVLIAIEIFINISMYLSTDVIPVRLVIATVYICYCCCGNFTGNYLLAHYQAKLK